MYNLTTLDYFFQKKARIAVTFSSLLDSSLEWNYKSIFNHEINLSEQQRVETRHEEIVKFLVTHY